MRVIAFCGPKESGKDTAAKCLFKHNEGYGLPLFRKAMFAAGVKNEGTDYFGWTEEQMDDPVFKETPIELWPGGPVMEPRWFMMDEANHKRDKIHREIHARRWERHCKIHYRWGAHVVTDLRFPDEEIPAIRRAGSLAPGMINMHEDRRFKSLIIYISRQEAEEKLRAAKEAGDSKALNPSEAYYDRLVREADFIIPNNGTIHELNNAVNGIVHNTFGHWKYWGVPGVSIKEFANEANKR